LKRTAAMARFPGENRLLSRAAKSWHRVERLQQIVGWMDKYISGGTAVGSEAVR